MSDFAVTVEVIDKIWEHTNADSLEMASLIDKNYDLVVMKEQYVSGDIVIFFPIDSILPTNILDAIGLTGKLSGKNRNIVKTIKLRGSISQGVVVAPSVLYDLNILIDDTLENILPGDDLTDVLGVEKYDLPIISSNSGDLVRLPEYVKKYDIEDAQNYPHLVYDLMDIPVFISEKIEGSNWAITWLAEDDNISVCQRNYKIIPIEGKEHTWHKAARTGKFFNKIKLMADMVATWGQNLKTVTIRGEIVGPGIQGNYYSLKEHEVYVFDIELNGVPMSSDMFFVLCTLFNIQPVPVISTYDTLFTQLDGRTLSNYSNGQSMIIDKPREGVVIKPMREMIMDEDIGRVFFKQRSPEYLLKN